jgi:precorrin-6B methylase 1
VRDSIASASDAFGYFPYVARLQGLEHLQLHASDNREELERARNALNLAAQGRKVLMLSSGDPGVFAMASAVFETLEQASPEEHARWQDVDVQVQPGITAMLAAAARLGAPWDMTSAPSICPTTSSPPASSSAASVWPPRPISPWRSTTLLPIAPARLFARPAGAAAGMRARAPDLLCPQRQPPR